MAVIGIDLGFQSCLVAAPNSGGIEVLLNEYSQRKTASMVSFGEKQRDIGEAARTKAVIKYLSTVNYFEPLIGRRYRDPDVQAELARCCYPTCEMPDGSVGVQVEHLGETQTFSITHVTGMLLRKLKQVGEEALRTKVTDCVISVPVFFNDEQRNAVIAASKIAGLNCLRLMNETSAVALSYGIYKTSLPLDTEKPWRVVFCDMGSETMQMSACEFVKGKVTILATAHGSVGGRDFDEVIFDHFCTEFKTKFKVDVRSNIRAAWKLRLECEKLKQSMSANSTALPLAIECLMDDKDVNGHMCRTDFEALAQPLLTRVQAVASELLGLLGTVSGGALSAADFDAVELVGGAVRIPAVKNILHQTFGKETSTTLNLDECVAKGCALLAAQVSPNFRVREFEVVDKTPYGITLCWPAKDSPEGQEGSAEIFKPHGASKSLKMVTYYRSADCEFEAKYTNPESVTGKPSTIAKFQLKGVTPAADGTASKIKVSVKLDEHGIFQMTEATLVEKLPPVADEKADASQPMETDAPASPAAPDAPDAGAEPKEPKKADDSKKTPSKDKAAEEPAAKKAKTHKSIPLQVVVQRPFVASEKDINEMIERENQLAIEDRKEIEKSNAKNALEEYLYFIRDKILEEDVKVFIKESDAEAFSAQLGELESWLYEDGQDQEKSVYNGKLAELKKVGDPVLARYDESQKRPASEEAFRKAIVRVRKFLQQHAAGEEQYAHLTPEDIAKVNGELEAKEKWLNQQTAAQAQLLKYEPPAVTAGKLDAECASFEAVCNKVISKPKPKVEPPKKEEAKKDEPAKEEPKKEEPPKDGAAPSADAQADPAPPADEGASMDTSN